MPNLPAEHKRVALLAKQGFEAIQGAKVMELTEHCVLVVVANKAGGVVAWASNVGPNGSVELMRRALDVNFTTGKHFHPNDLKETFETQGEHVATPGAARTAEQLIAVIGYEGGTVNSLKEIRETSTAELRRAINILSQPCDDGGIESLSRAAIQAINEELSTRSKEPSHVEEKPGE